MNNTNEFLQDYATLRQRAKDFELRPPVAETGTNTFLWIMFGVLFTFILLLGLTPEEDFTDSGVGCIDDCLEPLTKRGEKHE